MQFRRLGLVLVTLLVVMSVLAGCVSGAAMTWPDREVPVDLDTALAAQDMAMAGAMMGSATLTESEFSSFITYLLKQNAGAYVPVDEVKVWFEPGNQIYIEAVPSAGVPLAGPIMASGTIGVENQNVVVGLDQAAVGPISAAGPILGVVEAAINRALADPSLGVAVNVNTDTGTVTLGLGM